MKTKFLVTLMLVIASGINAQQLLTLEEALSVAMNNNNYARMADNNSEISTNNYHIGNAGFLPKIDLIGSAIYNDNETDINGIKTSNKATNNSATISASYTLFDGLSRFYNYNKLETSAKIGRLEARTQKENIAYSVITAYYRVARAEDQVRIAKEALEISNERFLRTQKKVDYGQAGKVDYLNARVDFNTDSVNFISSRTTLEQAKQYLNLILNRDIDTQFGVISKVDFDELPSLSELVKLADSKNAENLIADNNVSIAEQNVNLSNSSYLPTLTLRSSYGYHGLYNDFNITLKDPNRTLTTSLNLSLNLFNGFSDNIKKQNSEIQLKNSKLLSDQTKKEITSEVASTFKYYRDSRTILKMEINNLEAAELNFQRTKELYELGKVTNTEFREAQLKLIQARNNISASKYNAKVYETEIKKLCGTLIDLN